MALPTTIVIDYPLVSHYTGPFIASNGDVYVVVLGTAALNAQIYAASNPEVAFSTRDSANEPSAATNHRCVNVVQDGDVLRMVTVDEDDTAGVEYHDWNMATNLWGTTNENIVDFSGQNPPINANRGASISIRGTGDPVVVLHANNFDKVMGQNRARLEISTRSGGGTWTNRGLAFGAASDEIGYSGVSSLTGANDGTHFVCQRTPDTNTISRTLDSSNSLSTASAQALANGPVHFLRGVTYADSAGTQRILWPYFNSAGRFLAIGLEEDGSGNITHGQAAGVGQISDVGNDVGVDGDSYDAGLALEGDTIVHALWSHETDKDIYHDVGVDPQVDTDWGTDVEERDAITAGLMSINIFKRLGDIKLAFMYVSGSNVIYDELILRASGFRPWPSPAKQMAHLILR